MDSQNIRIPDDIAEDVLSLASKYYADYQDSYTTADLVEVGEAVQIPAALIHQAIAEIQAQQRQAELTKQRQRQRRQQVLYCGIGVIAILGIWGAATFNHLNAARANVQAAWAQVENQQQRRIELIPELISLTKTAASHEDHRITQLTQAREAYLSASSPTEKSQAIANVDNALREFIQFSAQHPPLGNQTLWVNVQYELTGTANRLAVERKRYNEALNHYEKATNSFPSVIIAKLFGFQSQSFHH